MGHGAPLGADIKVEPERILEIGAVEIAGAGRAAACRDSPCAVTPQEIGRVRRAAGRRVQGRGQRARGTGRPDGEERRRGGVHRRHVEHHADGVVRHGTAGIPDFIGHYKGFYFAIETKVEKKNPTPLQVHQINAISVSGGKAFVIRGAEDLGELKEWVMRVDLRLV